MNLPYLERFIPKVDFSGECWLWGAAKTKGYGRFWLNGAQRQAHRVFYEECIGPIPDGLHIDHLCRTPACVNPWHMEPVTMLENSVARRAPREVTHCPQGHEYTRENTSAANGRGKHCRECDRIKHREKYIPLGQAGARKTHCPHGHEYNDANTYRRNGRRHCKTCRSVAGREWRARNKSTPAK